jgi:hypothetical protein
MAVGNKRNRIHNVFPVAKPRTMPMRAKIITPVHMCGAYFVGFAITSFFKIIY